MTDQPQSTQNAGAGEGTIEQVTVSIRRSPRYLNFVVIGAILGIIATLALTFAVGGGSEYSATQVFGFLLLMCLTVGITLMLTIAVVLDRFVGRTRHTVVADKIGTKAVTSPVDGQSRPGVTGHELLTDSQSDEPKGST